jgi:hypothetical protein
MEFEEPILTCLRNQQISPTITPTTLIVDVAARRNERSAQNCPRLPIFYPSSPKSSTDNRQVLRC